MASPPGQVYFPPLEECLLGSKTVLSWKLVADSLSDISCDRLTSSAVSAFLKDASVLNLLKNPSKVFEPPNTTTKTGFEARTAAINVTPTPNDKYDIKTIKADAQWLSQSLKVNEVAALRVVVVEFQSRPLAHLTGPLSSQDVASLQETVGANNPQAAVLLAPLALASPEDAEAIWSDFEKENSRRRRLVATYLSERYHFMASADQLMTFLLHSQPSRSGAAADSLRRSVLRDAFGFDLDADFNLVPFEALIPIYLGLLPACLDRSQSGLESLDAALITEELEVDAARSCLLEMVHAMSLVFQILDLSSQMFASPEVVSQWFQIMDLCAFMEGLQGVHESVTELVLPIKCLICTISITLLNLKRSLAHLDQDVELHEFEHPYLRSPEVLEDVHRVISAGSEANIVTATPIVFSWSLILHRMYISYQERVERRDIAQNQRARDGFELENHPSGSGRRYSGGSIVSIEHLPYDAFLTSGNTERDSQVVESLARSATAGGAVYDLITDMALCLGDGQDAAFRPIIGSRMRLVLLELLKVSFPVVGYLPEPVSALLSVLSGGRKYWDLSAGMPLSPTQDIVALAREDPEFRQFYLSQALHRFPYEFMPFISLCRILSTCASSEDRSDVLVEILFRTPTLTFVLPDWYNQYELAQEEDNSNTIRLLEDIPLFAPSSTWKRRIVSDEPFCIPKDTYGRFVTDSGRVVLLEYEHSALALLGKRLECNLAPDANFVQLGFLQPDESTEAIALLATLVRGEQVKVMPGDPSSASEGAMGILQEASKALPRTKDIITVICDTLDGLIQRDLANSDSAEMSVLAACLEFLDAILPICPGRVWSYMARCELLNTESRAGRLSAVIGSMDMVAERFECLTSSIKFFASLVDSTIKSTVQRKVGTGLSNRHRGAENPWIGTSDKILARVCLSIAQAIVDMFENSTTWRFSSELGRTSVLVDVLALMNRMASQPFGMGNPTASDDLGVCLMPAATHVIDSFLSSGSLRFQPLLQSLLAAFCLPSSTLYSSRTELITQRFYVVADFATTLLRTADYLELSSSVIQTQLFKVAFLFARLCAVRDSIKSSALQLLGALIVSANNVSKEPPSLLGYLGPQTSRSFIQLLSRLDRPYNRSREEVQTWKFFSTVMRSRQQWMANCLLTGKTPREALSGDRKLARPSSDSVLSAALDRLRSISSIKSEVALAALDFFTSAQNHWPWTIFATQGDDNAFLNDLRAYIHELKAPPAAAKLDAAEAALQARIAAYIADTFAMQLYHLRQMGKGNDFANKVINDLDYFLRAGVQVSGYNTSLHVNFARNFAARYPGCALDDFKRTPLSPRDLGPQYFYAVDTAGAMLSFDPAWTGQRDNGFRHELEMANLNLSLVDAEIALLHAWEYLLLELSICLLPTNQTLAKQMLQVAEQCLTSNQDPQGPDEIFVRINQSRADLALALLQRLEGSSQLPKDVSSLLTTVSVTVNGVENPFGADQIRYYRTLLKILYVVLLGSKQPGNSEADPGTIVAVTQTVLNILDRVVASGFRTLVSLVHEGDTSVAPEDIALITAILQACLCLPGIGQCQSQILNVMMSHDVLHVATSLFSWADKLADKGDPVYGELSLLFLLELSALPAIAEQLACDGLLGHLTSASLAGYMRRPNVSPFADNAGAARCYGIWAKGVLPLLLNVLTALSPTIAPEVAFVLNQFPNLLQSSVDRFEAPGLSRTASRDSPHFVTLLAVSEIQSLALLTRALAALRENNTRDVPAVVWDAPVLLENVEYWLSGRKVLRERLLPLGPREIEWKSTPATRAGCESKLEEKVVLQLEAVRDVLNEGS